MPRAVGLVLALGVAAQLAGCGAGAPSMLDTEGRGADRVAGLWWLMLWISVAVFLVVMLLIAVAVWRRRGPVTVRPASGVPLVVVGGILLPVIVLTAVYLIGLRDLQALVSSPGGSVTVEVEAHDWWWEVRYPGTAAVTANEIHIPVGEPVRFRLTSVDVIHSFWVPELHPKMDLIPGQTNELWLTAERAGTYRGQCAEYCGLQHARMALLVIAEPPGEFDRWLEREAAPAGEPTTALAVRGEAVLERTACATCHTVRGTSADGTAGPDLTHLDSRRTLGAVTVPNDRGHLSGWIVDSQSVKPGNLMPPQPLTSEELRALLAYLEGLE